MRRLPVSCTLLATLAMTVVAAAADVRGVVSKIDTNTNELVIDLLGPRVRGQQLTLVVDPETRVLLGGQPARLGELTAGKRVRVNYETRNGRHVASSITCPNVLGRLSGIAAPQAPAAPAIPAGADTVVGELRRVALTDRELVVITPGTKTETILAVPENLAVTKQGKPAQFEDLKEGEKAVVYFEERAGKRIATAVHVGEGVTAAPPDNRIQRVRQALKMVDMLLDLAERNKVFDR